MAKLNRKKLIGKHVENGGSLRKRFTPRHQVVKDLDDIKRELAKREIQPPEGTDTLYKFVISDDTEDRHEDTILVDGWQTETFNKSGAVLFAHKSGEPPVMKSLDTFVEDGALKSWAVNIERGLYDFADMISDMVFKGYLKMTSVGFVPLEYRVKEGHEDKWFPPMIFEKQDLTEYSVVPAGSNRNAFIEGVEEQHQEAFEEMSEKVLDGEVEVDERTEEEIAEARNQKIISIANEIVDSVEF